MLNRCILMGRLTKDPEIRYTTGSNPVAVARFNLAVDRNYQKDGKYPTDFFEIEAWRQKAEFAEKYFRKGQLIVAEGSFEQYQWTDKDNNKRQSYKLNVDNFYFAEKKQDNGDSGGRQNGGGNGKTPEYKNPAPNGFDPFMGNAGGGFDPFTGSGDMSFHISDDDLPV